MNQYEQHESDRRYDKNDRGGFDRDQPSEVAGRPLHQGSKRPGDDRSLQYQQSGEKLGILPTIEADDPGVMGER